MGGVSIILLVYYDSILRLVVSLRSVLEGKLQQRSDWFDWFQTNQSVDMLTITTPAPRKNSMLAVLKIGGVSIPLA